ncbi:MarR family winged helix-turn-helix transcriptional regulator [Roseovarius aestuariivivens]|uniref:MarR family winged helix-turn-helix transcriptional regulator n=1 Tax=Roseovarius aestuariivivens TaxID=1888910 RepID=UPI00108100C4|nr:MarR family transcriptional regulator [Roseovarius aestuariivivens]
MRADRLKLDDQLCFALYAATNAVTRAYRPRLAEIGLTYPQYLIMLVLWQDGPRTLGAIARRLCLAQNAITPLVDRLEKAGLVTRTRDPADRRVITIALTETGESLHDGAARAQHEVKCETLLDEAELAALRSTLFALVDRMKTETGHADIAHAPAHPAPDLADGG